MSTFVLIPSWVFDIKLQTKRNGLCPELNFNVLINLPMNFVESATVLLGDSDTKHMKKCIVGTLKTENIYSPSCHSTLVCCFFYFFLHETLKEKFYTSLLPYNSICLSSLSSSKSIKKHNKYSPYNSCAILQDFWTHIIILCSSSFWL